MVMGLCELFHSFMDLMKALILSWVTEGIKCHPFINLSVDVFSVISLFLHGSA